MDALPLKRASRDELYRLTSWLNKAIYRSADNIAADVPVYVAQNRAKVANDVQHFLRRYSRHRVASQLELLEELQQIGVRLVCDDPRYACKGTAKKAVEFTANQVAVIETVFDAYGEREPWGRSRAEQVQLGGGRFQTICGTLASIKVYAETHGHVPRPNVIWALRCEETCGDDSYTVEWEYCNGLSVHLQSSAAHALIGNLPGPNC